MIASLLNRIFNQPWVLFRIGQEFGRHWIDFYIGRDDPEVDALGVGLFFHNYRRMYARSIEARLTLGILVISLSWSQEY